MNRWWLYITDGSDAAPGFGQELDTRLSAQFTRNVLVGFENKAVARGLSPSLPSLEGC